MTGRSGDVYVQVATEEPADRGAGLPASWATAAACGDRELAEELRRVVERGLVGVAGPIGRALVRVVSRDDLVAAGGEAAIAAAARDLDRLAEGLWTNRRILADDAVAEARLRLAATRPPADERAGR